jgi:ethanolamine kinase
MLFAIFFSDKLQIMQTLKFIDLELDEKEMIEGAKKLILQLFPTWTNIEFEICTTGITNKLIKVTGKFPCVIRIYGHGSGVLIDRDRELLVFFCNENILELEKHNMCAPLYATFRNGIVYGYVEGTVFSVDDMSDPKKSRLLAEHLSEWHQLPISDPPLLIDTLERWINSIPLEYTNAKKKQQFAKTGISIDHLRNELDVIREKIPQFSSPIVFCHNDLLSGNIIYNPEKSLFF